MLIVLVDLKIRWESYGICPFYSFKFMMKPIHKLKKTTIRSIHMKPKAVFFRHICHACYWIYGARMMGGGFGGCVLHVAKHPPSESYHEQVLTDFTNRFGHVPTFLPVKLADGAGVIDI